MLRGNCDECKKLCRKFRKFQNKMLCFSCWSRKYNRIGCTEGLKPLTLDEALNLTYEIKGRINSKGGLSVWRTFPRCLAGKKVKLILVK